MSELEQLLEAVPNASVKKKLESLLSGLKREAKFGLVFEEHKPESVALSCIAPKERDTVQRRDIAAGDTFWKITKIDKYKKATLVSLDSKSTTATVDVSELLVVKHFGEPVYTALTPVSKIERAKDKPFHSVINGENFHALQLLLFQFQGQIDCIYIDPPYNTGARDWKYNNRYVDDKDSWRHSKWLSFMEKRLRLARKLLKPDGVLIVTIDDYEVHHLGLLLEKVMPDYLRYTITIVINPKGRDKENFAPVHEYAFFMVPNLGRDVIDRAPKENKAQSQASFDFSGKGSDEGAEDYDENCEDAEEDDENDDKDSSDKEWEFRHARRRGGGAEMSSYREKRPNQFYPIYIDEEKKRVVRAGKSIPLGAKHDTRKVGGLRPLWPIDTRGNHRVWAFNQESMQRLIDEGHVFLGKFHAERDDWTLKYRVPKKTSSKLKSVWWSKSYDAGTHGTELIKKFLGRHGLFPFPKSVYAVRDTLAAVVRSRPNALILDFFGGSGTTLHATCLLNSEDGGKRRCILVTNNEVEEKIANQLLKQGDLPGDPEFEKHGIFELVTKPRCEAVISGKRADGSLIEGNHIDSRGAGKGRPLSCGFEENVEFFKLDYLDPNRVDLGRAFKAILPTIWLASGGVGKRELPGKNDPYSIPETSTYAVLFKESHYKSFREAIRKRPDVTHIWLITDSEEAFAEMRSDLAKTGILQNRRACMLYRDYLRNFEINTERSL